MSDQSTDEALKLRMTRSYLRKSICLLLERVRGFFRPWTAVLIKQADLGDISGVY